MLSARKCYDRLRGMFIPRSDLPFANDDAAGFLPWIIACIVCLTALLVAAALSVSQVIDSNQDAYARTLTVYIPHSAEYSSQDIQKIMNIVANEEGVADVKLLEKELLKSLISPWVGEGTPTDLLPLPVVIEAAFENEIPDITAIEKAIKELVPGAELQKPEIWVEKFSSFNRSVRIIALLLASMLLAATVSMVVLSAKTALKLHDDIVTLLHSIGAKDEYITRQFQINALMLTFRGAVAGTIAAAIIFSALSYLVQGMEAPLLPEIRWSLLHMATFVALPVVTAATAFYVARKTVSAELEAMP